MTDNNCLRPASMNDVGEPSPEYLEYERVGMLWLTKWADEKHRRDNLRYLYDAEWQLRGFDRSPS